MMVSIFDLWLPIVVSSLFVFVVSSLIHMVFNYHKNDFVKLPDEDGVMEAMRNFNIPPGDYVIPCAGDMKTMKSEAFIEKAKKGPTAFMTVINYETYSSMGASLAMWFLYSILVSIFAAYIGGRALEPDAHYLNVFRFVGASAFMGYSFALMQNSIWYKRNWCSTIKSAFDGLIYALVTAGTFGWLWPSL